MNEIFETIKKIAVKIGEDIKYADLGYTDHANATGDTQLKLDVRSDEIITAEFTNLACVKALVSEEKEDMLSLNEDAKFIVAYDPLDGSSLVDVNFSIGAAYVVYGPRLELVLCTDRTAPAFFRLDKDGEFRFIRYLALAQKGKLNATGATQKGWSETHAKFIRELFLQGYRLRYSGAMVSDLHQILLKGGGLFSYPATTDAPKGKLRALFEVLPFAFIYERAGGATSDGYSATLFDMKVEKIHQTTPCFFGSKDEINLLHKFYGSAK